MGFVVFSILAWLVVSLFAVIKKKLTIVENTLIFLIILIISINFSWIVIEELKLIKLSRAGLAYTAFILNRSVIIPILILIQVNLLQWSKTMMMKIAVFVSVVILLMGISFLSNFYDISEYKQWNYWNDGIYFFILNFVGIYSYKLFARVSQNVGSYS